MSDEARHIIERRRLRRRVGLWRVIAILAIASAGAVVFWRTAPVGDHIARFEIAGVIFDDPVRDDLLMEIAGDDSAKALILRIDSPGGSVAGSEALFLALRAVAERKPVVAVMGEMAASGGYIAALGADWIIARGGTITGSIGVIAQYPNVADLLDTIGVSVERIASSELKAEPSPFRDPPAEAIEAQASMIDDSYAWFVGLVAERRGMDPETARRLGDGRVYTGRQAREAGLIDALGGEREAIAWLAASVDGDLPVRDVAPELDAEGLLGLLGGGEALARLQGWLSGPRLLAVMR